MRTAAWNGLRPEQDLSMTRLPDRDRELLLEFTGKLLIVPHGLCGKGSHDYLRPSFPLLRRLPGTMLALSKRLLPPTVHLLLPLVFWLSRQPSFPFSLFFVSHYFTAWCP